MNINDLVNSDKYRLRAQAKKPTRLVQGQDHVFHDPENARIAKAAYDTGATMMPGLGIGWEQMMNGGAPWQTTNGSTSTAVTTMQDITPVDFVIPAYSTAQGQVWQITAAGILTTATSTPGTLTLTGYCGGTSLTTAIISTGALTLYTSATNACWQVQIYIRIHGAPSATTAVYSFGTATGITAAGGTNMIPATASAGAPGSLNATTTNLVQLGAQFSSSTTNTITCYQFFVESLD